MKPQTFPKLSLRKLSHDEIYIIVMRILSEWKKQEITPTTIRLLIRELNSHLTTLQKIQNREMGSELTKKINELDELRDRAYKLLVKKIRLSQDEFETSVVEAGKALLPAIEKFNSDIVRLGLTEQTSLMQRAFDEFAKPEYAPHHTTLNIQVDLERAIQFNNDFESAWQERSALGNEDEDLPHMRTLRKNLESDFRLLLNNSEFLYNQNHNSISEKLFSVIEQELVKAGTTVKMRETRAENKESSVS